MLNNASAFFIIHKKENDMRYARLVEMLPLLCDSFLLFGNGPAWVLLQKSLWFGMRMLATKTGVFSWRRKKAPEEIVLLVTEDDCWTRVERWDSS